jgi:hypothetical protein
VSEPISPETEYVGDADTEEPVYVAVALPADTEIASALAGVIKTGLAAVAAK